MGRLEGKSVIITGAGSGIGRAASLLFSREGAKLVIVDRSDSVMETARLVSESGGTVEAVIIDAPVAQNAVEESGGVEIAEKVPTEEEYGIALAKDNTGLLEEINTGLAEVIEDGTYTTIYEKWFKLEPPKEIVG